MEWVKRKIRSEHFDGKPHKVKNFFAMAGTDRPRTPENIIFMGDFALEGGFVLFRTNEKPMPGSGYIQTRPRTALIAPSAIGRGMT